LKEYNKICNECNKNFISHSSKAMFCSSSCKYRSLKKNNKKEYKKICLFCGNGFISFNKKPKFCSLSCSAKHKNINGNGKKYFCKNCNIEFNQIHNRHYFCSDNCKSEYYTKRVKTKTVFCSSCNKEIIRIRSLKNKNYFCCKNCESEFREKEADEIRICKCCDNKFKCKKHDKLVFCSKKCQIIGLSKKPTNPHVIIINILNKLNVNFEIEHPVKRYSIDNYLIDYNLCIEIMGSYWHLDNRRCNKIETEKQKHIVEKDKKRSDILSLLGLKILYLWELDINKDLDICMELILLFIKNNGNLDNYHSMNYSIVNGILQMNEDIIIPHFEK